MRKVIQGNVNLYNLYLNELPTFLENVAIYGQFNCNVNFLTSLKGSPRAVSNNFFCQYNQLTSLEGGPKIVGGVFCCHSNPLSSLKGLPEVIGRDLYISFSPGIDFSENEIRKASDIGGKIYLNGWIKQ
jgi:hypothetical protein